MARCEDTETQASGSGRYRFPDGRPKSTGATLHDSIVRVLLHDTRVDNDTVRITIEHPDLNRGVKTFLRYDHDNVVGPVRRSIAKLSDHVVRVDLVDEAGIGVSEDELLGETGTVMQPGPEVAEVQHV